MGFFSIPEIGDRVILTADWTFGLVRERRNEKLWQVMADDAAREQHRALSLRVEDLGRATCYTTGGTREERIAEYEKAHARYSEAFLNLQRHELRVTLPAETILEVDRIYIRQKKEDFSSLSFNVPHCPLEAFANAPKAAFGRAPWRFFVSLADANAIEGRPAGK